MGQTKYIAVDGWIEDLGQEAKAPATAAMLVSGTGSIVSDYAILTLAVRKQF